MKTALKCKVCATEVAVKNIINGHVACPQCFNTYPLKERASAPLWVNVAVFIGVIVALVGVLKWAGIFDTDDERLRKQIGKMSFNQASQMKDICLKQHNKFCLKFVYKRLNELDPTEATWKANYAFQLTGSGQHKEALPLYESLLSSGEETYDLMAYYGMSLEGVGQIEKAAEWYQSSLAVNPAVLDVTQKLASIMAKTQRTYEAAALVDSFIQTYPRSKGFLQANSVLLHKQLGEKDEVGSKEKLRLMAVRGAHHYLPLKVGQESVSFLVDTGATALAMSTEQMRRWAPESMSAAQEIRVGLADGRTKKAFIAIIPEVKVGPWTVRDVETTYCDGCSLLAGRALLRHFVTKTIPNGNLETMEIAFARQ